MKHILSKQRPLLIISIVLYIVCAAIETYFAVILGRVIDSATTSKTFELLINAIIAIGLLCTSMITYWFALYTRSYYVKRNIYNIKQSLIMGIYKKRTDEENSFFLNMLTSDLDQLETNYLLPKPILFLDLSQFIFAIIALLYISWKVTLIFSVLFLIPILIPQIYGKKLTKRMSEKSDYNEKYTFEVKEQIQGMNEIISSLSVVSFIRKFAKVNESQQEAHRKSIVSERYIGTISSVCGLASQVGCMVIGGIFVIKNEISVGELIAAIQLLNSVFNPISSFSQNLAIIKSSKCIISKISDYLIHDCEIKEIQIRPENAIIEYKNVSVEYDGNCIIRSFSKRFEEGKTYAVIGKSGSGKSSLIKCMLNNKTDYDGEITIGGIETRQLSDEELYNIVGYVSQNAYIFNDTINNNITMLNQYSEKALDRVIDIVQLKDLSEKNSCQIGDNGKGLSGGELQRIAIARALIHNPKIIIFDEPTSALDPASREKINEMIFSLKGYTRIIITHDCRNEYLSRFDEIIRL